LRRWLSVRRESKSQHAAWHWGNGRHDRGSWPCIASWSRSFFVGGARLFGAREKTDGYTSPRERGGKDHGSQRRSIEAAFSRRYFFLLACGRASADIQDPRRRRARALAHLFRDVSFLKKLFESFKGPSPRRFRARDRNRQALGAPKKLCASNLPKRDGDSGEAIPSERRRSLARSGERRKTERGCGQSLGEPERASAALLSAPLHLLEQRSCFDIALSSCRSRVASARQRPYKPQAARLVREDAERRACGV